MSITSSIETSCVFLNQYGNVQWPLWEKKRERERRVANWLLDAYNIHRVGPMREDQHIKSRSQNLGDSLINGQYSSKEAPFAAKSDISIQIRFDFFRTNSIFSITSVASCTNQFFNSMISASKITETTGVGAASVIRLLLDGVTNSVEPRLAAEMTQIRFSFSRSFSMDCSNWGKRTDMRKSCCALKR